MIKDDSKTIADFERDKFLEFAGSNAELDTIAVLQESLDTLIQNQHKIIKLLTEMRQEERSRLADLRNWITNEIYTRVEYMTQIIQREAETKTNHLEK